MELPVEAADGHRFVLRWHPACAREGGTLLFLPALGVPAEKYDRFALALTTQGVSVAVPEWRGIASSSLRASRSADWGYPELLRLDLPAARAVLAAHAPDARLAIGGHSLGGQIAALAAALEPEAFTALVLIATGVPDARTFPGRHRFGIRAFALLIPPLTRAFGYFPGQHLRWAGREAATLMRQWAGTVRSGTYDAVGIPDLEARLRALRLPVLAVRFSEDWLAPPDSTAALLGKLGAPGTTEVFDRERLGEPPDHFRWLRAPAALATRVSQWLRVSS